MAISPLAGKPAPPELLIDVPKLIDQYYSIQPDPDEPSQKVEFGTSGHRGSSAKGSFNQNHILAISQAICEYRAQKGQTGPLFVGMDTHALSGPAFETAVEVFAANGQHIRVQAGRGYTPTPVISHAILSFNKGRREGLADGVVITPSHNPPEDGGFKYNPPAGGPADTDTTKLIQDRANEILAGGLAAVKRLDFAKAIKAATTEEYDYVEPYINDLANILDMPAITEAGVKIGVDPMGGSGVAFWQPMARKYTLNMTIVNQTVDPTFSFMRVDKDGKIRMDCSSPYAMAGLIDLKDNFDIAFGNDPDYDRHGIVTDSGGLMNPNHYLAVAVWYLFQHRPKWASGTGIGKTLVTSSIMDRVAADLGRRLVEVPVGFKWFVDGLLTGDIGFGGEESAGASFLRADGTVWSTDKDGFIMDLLAVEIMAKTKKDPWQIYQELTGKYGAPVYERLQAPADPAQKAKLKNLSPENVKAAELAGEPILAKITRAPGNNAPIGGLKVATENGWFAARPSGTEDIYKIYCESFKGADHLEAIKEEAQAIVSAALAE